MKNPYAISNFESIRLEGYEYIDRTNRIPLTENVGKYLLFLRPRRFGKSLWLTTLKNYYDIDTADRFENVFSGTWIYDNPTPIHNNYYVMEWDFSCVDCSGSNVEQSLYQHINDRIYSFASDYEDILPEKIKIHPNQAMASFSNLLSVIRKTGHKLYLFIDEYDNFANEMIANKQEEAYFSMTGLGGFMKTLFKQLKSATKGLGLDRMYLTGVTPILLSDVTSGDNIRTDIHMLPDFSDLCGFTDLEIKELIKKFADSLETSPRYQQVDIKSIFQDGKQSWINDIYRLMKNCYDGYIFSPYTEQRIYNPTLVMYLLKHIEQLYGQLPTSLMDHNLVTDEGRLEYIADLPGGKEMIMEVNQDKYVDIPEVTSRFGLRAMTTKSSKTKSFMGSYLYFMGMLTLGKISSSGERVLSIPNPVTQSLYIDGIARWIMPDPKIRDNGHEVALKLVSKGRISPIRNYIEKHIFPTFNWRDNRWVNELTIKTIFMCLLRNKNFFMISERQSRSGYADLAMIVRQDCRKFQLIDTLIEFKFIKSKELKLKNIKKLSDTTLFKHKMVQKKLQDARKQAQTYSKELIAEFGNIIKLQTYAIISIGFDRL
ncbi:MAG: AAA family ATPase, partial [Candidatus Magnetomorum sp.]|nr:AAA family ATPase [Candidatus Magnetomorum sp.]